MKSEQTTNYILLRWISAPLVAILSLTLNLFGGVGAETINEELRKGNNLMAFVISVGAGFLAAFLPIFLGMSIAPNHRKTFGIVVGLLVTLSLLALYMYLGVTYDFTLPIIGRLSGIMAGAIGSSFLIAKGAHDELNLWTQDKT